MSRDTLRSSLLSTGEFPTRTVTLPDGQTVTVRGITIGERDAIREQCISGQGEARRLDTARWSALMMVRSARDEQGAPLFDEADVPAILELPVGHPIQRVIDAAIDINSPEARGNSGAGQTGN